MCGTGLVWTAREGGLARAPASASEVRRDEEANDERHSAA